MVELLFPCLSKRCYKPMNPTFRPLVKVLGLSKSYGRRRVLNQLEFDVASGSGLVVKGSNGSGKTTLLEILATTSRPDEGLIEVCGTNISDDPALIRTQIGFVAHSPYLYPQLTVKENLIFFSRLHLVPSKTLDKNILLTDMGLDTRLDQRVSTLSHGFRKRVSIVRALLHQPSVLLLDEPETGLDEETMNVLKRLIKSFVVGGGAVILTTHLEGIDYGAKMENIFLERGKLIGSR